MIKLIFLVVEGLQIVVVGEEGVFWLYGVDVSMSTRIFKFHVSFPDAVSIEE